MSLLLFTGGSQFAFVGILAGRPGWCARGDRRPPASSGSATASMACRCPGCSTCRVGAASWPPTSPSTSRLRSPSPSPTGSPGRLGFWVTGFGVFVFWNLHHADRRARGRRTRGPSHLRARRRCRRGVLRAAVATPQVRPTRWRSRWSPFLIAVLQRPARALRRAGARGRMAALLAGRLASRPTTTRRHRTTGPTRAEPVDGAAPGAPSVGRRWWDAVSTWTAVLLACAFAFALKFLGYVVPTRLSRRRPHDSGYLGPAGRPARSPGGRADLHQRRRRARARLPSGRGPGCAGRAGAPCSLPRRRPARRPRGRRPADARTPLAPRQGVPEEGVQGQGREARHARTAAR